VSTEANAALDAGRAALETRRWLEGYELLRAADARDLLDAAALEAHAGAAAQVDDDHGACGEPADALLHERPVHRLVEAAAGDRLIRVGLMLAANGH